MTLETGKVIAEKFEITERIASGGMGTVYKARDLILDRVIVLKVLQPSSDSSKAIIRFQNEAKILGRLNHPGIGGVYDIGALDSGDPYIAMEFIDGITLQKFIESRKQLPLSQLLAIFASLADALGHAHSAGVVHRDIKPSNIMLIQSEDKTYSPVLVDFGIAKLDDGITGGEAQKLTAHGALIGSPLYMSPEQCEGKRATAESDQYALGCVFYECLTGSPPFVGETQVETFTMHINNQPEPPNQHAYTPIPDGLNDLVLTMLAKQPEHRISGIAGVVALLDSLSESVISDEAERGHPAMDAPEVPVHKKRSHYRAGLTAIVICSAFGFIFVSLIFPKTTETSRALIEAQPKPTANENTGLVDEIRAELKSILKDKKADVRFTAVTQRYVANVTTGVSFSDTDLKAFKGVDDELGVLKDIPFAKTVDLSHLPITGKSLKYFNKSKVTELRLAGTGLTDLDNIADYQWLDYLQISHCPLGDDAMKKLSTLPRLTGLEMLDNSAVSDKGIKELTKLRTLKSARLDCPKVSKKLLSELPKLMPSCAFPLQGWKTAVVDSSLKEGIRLLRAGKPAEALPLLKEVSDTITRAQGDDAPLAVRPLYNLSQCYEATNQFPEMKKAVEQTLKAARAANNPHDLALALGRKGHYLKNYGNDPTGAMRAWDEQRSLNDVHGYQSVDEERSCKFRLAQLHRELGTFNVAKSLYERCCEIDRALENKKGKRRYANDLVGLALTELSLNQLEDGEKCIREAIEIFPPQKNEKQAEEYKEIAIAGSVFFERIKKYEQAFLWAEKAYRKQQEFKLADPDNRVVKFLAKAMRDAGRVSEAEIFEKSFSSRSTR